MLIYQKYRNPIVIIRYATTRTFNCSIDEFIENFLIIFLDILFTIYSITILNNNLKKILTLIIFI